MRQTAGVPTIRLALAQVNYTVGDLGGNASTVLDRAERDLYEHAAALRAAAPDPPPDPRATEPYIALLLALT